MARYFVMKNGNLDHSFWESFDKAKIECDAAKVLYGVPFTVEKRETIYSSETLDDLLKEETAVIEQWEVLENDKPAVMDNHPWLNNKFSTLDEALNYAHAWLGELYSPGVDKIREQAVNQFFYYNGFGDVGDYIMITRV